MSCARFLLDRYGSGADTYIGPLVRSEIKEPHPNLPLWGRWQRKALTEEERYAEPTRKNILADPYQLPPLLSSLSTLNIKRHPPKGMPFYVLIR